MASLAYPRNAGSGLRRCACALVSLRTDSAGRTSHESGCVRMREAEVLPMQPFLLRFVLCAALVAAAQGPAGWAQACGDFNGDGFDDLAIGVPWEDDYDFVADVGAVHVLYAAPSGGLSAAGEDFFFPADLGLTNSSGGCFGFALAAFDW